MKNIKRLTQKTLQAGAVLLFLSSGSLGLTSLTMASAQGLEGLQALADSVNQSDPRHQTLIQLIQNDPQFMSALTSGNLTAQTLENLCLKVGRAAGLTSPQELSNIAKECSQEIPASELQALNGLFSLNGRR